MARFFTTTLTADGTTTVPIHNNRGQDRQIYSVYISGTFGSGTVTAFLQADGTNNIAILDASDAAISLTANGMFNFEANSDDYENPIKLVLVLAGSSGASINYSVCKNI